jgi:hypothetical protein
MYFKIDPEQITAWLTKFKSTSATYSTYYFFDCKNLSFNKASSIENLLKGSNIEQIGIAGVLETSADIAASSKRNNLQTRYDTFVAGQTLMNKTNASAIFSMIVHCLPLNLIREHDLTLVFGCKPFSNELGGSILTRKRVSFVDYIDALLTPDEIPDNKIKFLHKFVQKSCQIPKMFILNKILQDL